jgi:hypothetical protein
LACQNELPKGFYLNSIGEAIWYDRENIVLFPTSVDSVKCQGTLTKVKRDLLLYCFDKDGEEKEIDIILGTKNNIIIHSKDECINSGPFSQGDFFYFDVTPFNWDSIVISKEISTKTIVKSFVRDTLANKNITSFYIDLLSEIGLIFSGRIDQTLQLKSTSGGCFIAIYNKSKLLYEKRIIFIPSYLKNFRSLVSSEFLDYSIE